MEKDGSALGGATRLFVQYERAFLLHFCQSSINIGYLIGGTVIVEQIFSLPGMGSLLIGSIGTRDYAIIQLVTLIFALLVIAVNLVADLLYSLLDPRISLAR